MLHDSRHDSDSAVRGSTIPSGHSTETRGFKIALTIVIICIFIAIFFMSRAQAETVIIKFTAPTHCDPTGPMTECALTGFRLEQQNGADWLEALTVAPTATQFTVEGLGFQQYFWRARALSYNGPSRPSLIVSKTFVDASIPKPAAPAIVRRTIQTNAYRVSVNYSTFRFVRGSLSGTVALNVPCDFRTTGEDYHYVQKAAVKALPGASKPDYNVAKCSIL